MRTGNPPTAWYTEACRRARAADRRRRAHTDSDAWPELAPPVPLSDGPLGEIQAADREIARLTAVRARAVSRFAAARPATVDRAQGEPGAMSAERWAARPEALRQVSEWAAQELVVALSLSSPAAETLLSRSLDLVHRLPGTLAALEAGALHPGHLWTMLDKVAPIEDAVIRAEVEATLLRWSAGRVVAPPQLNRKALREVTRRDVRAAARRLEKALLQRGIYLRADGTDGMATLTVVATMPEAQALHRALVACAEALTQDDDPRTRGQKMLDCLLELVLRPGETDLPPVQVLLTVVASIATLTGGDEPGEVDGQVVPAEMVRQLLAALTGMGLGRPAGTTTDADGADPDGTHPDGTDSLDTGAAGTTDDGTDPAGARLDGTDADGLYPDGTDPDGTHPDGPDANGPGAAPEACPAAGPSWEEREQQELASWWAEMERRVLSGELGDPDPDAGPPSPDHLSSEMPDVGGWDDADPPGPPGRRAQAPEPAPSADARSWATADRALDDAGHAVEDARRTVARAERAVHAAAAADAADEDAWTAGPAGRVTRAEDAVAALEAATDAQRGLLADLLATAGGGGLADRPRIALVDALSGALVALSDLPGLRRAGSCGRAACRRPGAGCSHDLGDRPGLGPPGPTNGYRPAAELDRFVRARDRRCRFPGCGRRVPRGGELDHSVAHPMGATGAANLVGYCTTHHRGKHQAPGWVHRLDADGTLTVTTPTGLVAVTTPPPY
ncbi:HNH endonuclease signature motif containing protein [Blastococcus sp. TF02-9]|uniref:HNH endonuclease signature motif containing protein n=1 Tax=Blastococcus sp. TF02-09 TaxID=2250576 RepID=UPI0018F486FA|nr:HNH endonuclease signature motif containing protein [Blastococcus sp. TF02-9]